MLKLEQDIEDIKRQVAQLQQSDKEKRALLNMLSQKLENVLKTVTRSNADLSSEVSSLLDEIRALQGELETNAYKLNSLTNKLQKTPPPLQQPTSSSNVTQPQSQPGSMKAPPSPSVQANENKYYKNAYRSYLSGQYSLAIDRFKKFLELFPKSQLADNAQYWIGECYFSEKQFRFALSEFYQLTQKFPYGDKVPAALLKMGLCYLELQRPNQARDIFEKLIKYYPTTSESTQANEKLKLLN